MGLFDSNTPLSGQSAGGYLPFTDDLYGNMGRLHSMISDTYSSTPMSQDFGAAMDYARQDASRRGIQGPLAAHLGAEAANDFQNRFSQMRFDRLKDLLGMQSDLGMRIQDAEQRRRDAIAQQRAAALAHKQAVMRAIFKMGGTALGAGIGSLAGNPVAGAGIGGAIGGAAPDIMSGLGE